MNQRGRGGRLSVVLVTVCGLAGCGGDGGLSAETEAGHVPGVELSGAAVERIRAEAPEVLPELAAAQGELLVVGGIESTDDPMFLEVAPDAFVVDTATGEASDIDAPRADVPVRVQGAAGGTNGFVVVAERCTDGHQLPVEDWLCAPGSGTAFLLANGSDTWEEIPFPDEVSPSRGEAPWTFQAQVGATPAGDVFAVVRSGPSAPEGPKVTRLVVLADGSWTVRSALRDEPVIGACASDEGFFVLTSTSSAPPVGDGTPPSADMALYEVPPAGGDPRSVALPDVDTSFGGVAVALACDGSGAYLTSSTSSPDAPMLLFGRRGGDWQSIGGQWPAGIVQRLASAPDGVAVVSMAMTADGFDAHTVSAGEDETTTLEPRYGERQFVPDATAGDFVTVGPISSYALGVESDITPQAVTIDRVDP
jgi:hypothetical protein